MLTIYLATKMTGRDKKEQVERAQYISDLFATYGIKVLSPILEEKVLAVTGPLINDNEARLRDFWKQDKFIIRRLAHAVVIDGAEQKSFGVEREYMLSRGVLWKPTILLMPKTFLNVSQFEDDFISDDPHTVAQYLHDVHGTLLKRWKWRINMLAKSLPKWLLDQAYQWR